MVCDGNETDLDIRIPAVMLPQDAGASLKDSLKYNKSGKFLHTYKSNWSAVGTLFFPPSDKLQVNKGFSWLMISNFPGTEVKVESANENDMFSTRFTRSH